jgi:hypothetical protein
MFQQAFSPQLALLQRNKKKVKNPPREHQEFERFLLLHLNFSEISCMLFQQCRSQNAPASNKPFRKNQKL